jgi:ATP-dependent exoDNAse (exonuclease V) beta subunit
VVIFPCDVDIYRQINPKVWLNKLPDNFNNFNELLVSYNKDLSFINNRGLEIYNQQREELELDNFNLLYVALTRSIEQLYVITERKISSKGEEYINFYSGIFINYLKKLNLWNTDIQEYKFGNKERVSSKNGRIHLTEVQQNFISTSSQDHNLFLLASSSKLWNTKQEKAIDYGNLLHEIFAKIETKNDVEWVINSYYQQGILNTNQFKEISRNIKNVVYHPKLSEYFSKNYNVYTEREILDIDNSIIIPDRLVFKNKNEVVIIDYKTGNKLKKHQQQLLRYEKTLQNIGFRIHKKILIYINNDIKIVEIN